LNKQNTYLILLVFTLFFSNDIISQDNFKWVFAASITSDTRHEYFYDNNLILYEKDKIVKVSENGSSINEKYENSIVVWEKDSSVCDKYIPAADTLKLFYSIIHKSPEELSKEEQYLQNKIYRSYTKYTLYKVRYIIGLIKKQILYKKIVFMDDKYQDFDLSQDKEGIKSIDILPNSLNEYLYDLLSKNINLSAN